MVDFCCVEPHATVLKWIRIGEILIEWTFFVEDMGKY